MEYMIAVLTLAGSAGLADGANLAKNKNCMQCHAVEAKSQAPSFKDIAARYNNKDIAQLAASIQKGSVNKWGKTSMPADPKITADEATKLAEWVLKQK